MSADEEGTLAQLKAHRHELVDRRIKKHRGHIIKTTGDGMPVEFVSVVDAVQCAVEVQRAMVERNAGATLEHRIEFRVGINVGDIIEDEGDIFEDGVNTAARLESIAIRGGICISQQMVDPIEGKLKLQFRELGRQNLKNISKPIEAYSVDLDETGSPASRVLRAANLKQDIRHARPRRSQSAGGFSPRNSGWYTWRAFRYREKITLPLSKILEGQS